MHVVFDLDGTLADTRALVVQAYAVVGVNMPQRAWGKPAAEWLPGIVGANWHEVHRLKNVAMRALAATSPIGRLPAAALAFSLSLDSDYRVSILTGASWNAAVATRRDVGLAHLPFLLVGATQDEKLKTLIQYVPGVYLDDDHATCLCVAEQTNWQVVYVSEEADREGLLKAFITAEELCKVSSSPQD